MKTERQIEVISKVATPGPSRGPSRSLPASAHKLWSVSLWFRQPQSELDSLVSEQMEATNWWQTRESYSNTVSILSSDQKCHPCKVTFFFWDSCNISRVFKVKSKWKSLSRIRGLYSPWNSPGQNTGVGSLPLLQRIVPIQGSNPGLPHCRQILNQLSHKGSPLSQNCERQHLGTYHSHMDHWKIEFTSYSYAVSQKESLCSSYENHFWKDKDGEGLHQLWPKLSFSKRLSAHQVCGGIVFYSIFSVQTGWFF